MMPPVKSAGEFLGKFFSISESGRRMKSYFFLLLNVVVPSHDGWSNGSHLGSMR